MASPITYLAILVCHVRTKDGQVVTTLVTTQGKPGFPPVLVMGEAVMKAMTDYETTPDNNIAGFSIIEIRLQAIEPPETFEPKKPTPRASRKKEPTNG